MTFVAGSVEPLIDTVSPWNSEPPSASGPSRLPCPASFVVNTHKAFSRALSRGDRRGRLAVDHPWATVGEVRSPTRSATPPTIPPNRAAGVAPPRRSVRQPAVPPVDVTGRWRSRKLHIVEPVPRPVSLSPSDLSGVMSRPDLRLLTLSTGLIFARGRGAGADAIGVHHPGQPSGPTEMFVAPPADAVPSCACRCRGCTACSWWPAGNRRLWPGPTPSRQLPAAMSMRPVDAADLVHVRAPLP